MTRSIGIDLGTTYSCVIAHSSDGIERVIPSEDGGELTPSVVHISPDGEVTVGEDAKRRMAEDPDNTIVGIKRHMGKDHPLEYAGRVFTPEGISSLILSRLAADASAELGVPRGELAAVITVPAYFGAAEKEATIAAARIADLTCLTLLPEPVAAAYAYGLAKEPHRTSLVYDLGGGTFDVAVVGIQGGEHRVWAVDGESRLGGLDWDRRVEDLLWAEVEALPNGEDLRYEDDVIAAVESASERIKRKLTGADHVSEGIRAGGASIRLGLTRERFEEVTRDLVLRTLEAVDRVLRGAKEVGAPEVDQVLLVGGSTRMPVIREALTEHLELPVLIADPDRSVARGAAIHAEQLLAAREGREITVNGLRRTASSMSASTSVLPRALGILIHTSHEPYSEEPMVQLILPANTPLPVRRHEHSVATVAHKQTKARIQLYEQGGNIFSPVLADNKPLIEAELDGIPPGEAGTRISLWISVSTEGRVSLEASASQGRARLSVEAFVHGVLDEAELEAQKTSARSLSWVR